MREKSSVQQYADTTEAREVRSTAPAAVAAPLLREASTYW
jgi:hypothetical protein